jgi:hypothetical protein
LQLYYTRFLAYDKLATTESLGVFSPSGSNRLLALAEPRFGQLRQFHRGQFDGGAFGVDCLLIAGDGHDEQRALRWKAACKVQQLKLASLVHGAGYQEMDFERLGVQELGVKAWRSCRRE